MTITPSKPDYWTGTRAKPDDRFTRQQQVKAAAMAAEIMRNRRRFGLPETYRVKINVEERAHGQTLVRPQMVECPVIGSTKDRKTLRVIAPNGMDTWVVWQQ